MQHTVDTVTWSGKEDSHEGGVVLIKKKETLKAVVKWTPLINETVVCYTPTEATEQESKFYNSLQATIETISNMMCNVSWKTSTQKQVRETKIKKASWITKALER